MALHAMIDLETLSTENNAVITQIGVALFDPTEKSIAATYEWYPDPEQQIALGRHVSFSTLKWWLNQSEEARAGFNRQIKLVEIVMAQFLNEIDWSRIEAVWGHGATFDPVLMVDFLKIGEYSAPWKYNQVRDTRTLFWLLPTEMEKAKVKHSALDDAIAQVFTVQKAYARFNEMKQIWTNTPEKNVNL